MFNLLIAFLSPLLAAATNVIDSRVANAILKKVDAVVFYSSITNILVLPLLLLFGTPRLMSKEDLPLMALACLVDLAYQFPYYAAMKRIDTSVTAALMSLGELSIPFLAWFMIDEKLTLRQYTGFGVIIFFNIALSMKNSGKLRINTAFWLMLLASNLLAFEAVLLKKIMLNLDWLSTMFYLALFTSVMSLGLLIRGSCRHDIFRHFPQFAGRWKLFLLDEIFGQSAAIAAMYAISALPVVVFTAIDNTEPIFTLLYGAVLYYFFGKSPREKVDPQTIGSKLVFFAFIILGVILAAGG